MPHFLWRKFNMKALAIDSASPCITIAAQNDEKTSLVSLDISMRQSEKIVPAIDYVLNQCDLLPKDLQFTTLCAGPGTFTGLRLAFSALKALQLAYNCPIYAIPTLEAIFFPYSDFSGLVIPVLDAKKDRFYASIYRNGKAETNPMDISVADIQHYIDPEETVFVAGYDSMYFKEKLQVICPAQKIITPMVKDSTLCSFSLLQQGKQKYLHNEPALQKHEGPIYIRKSEAEENKQK